MNGTKMAPAAGQAGSAQRYRAWVMVVAKVPEWRDAPHSPLRTLFNAGEEIRRRFPDAMEVVGPYDVVTEVTGGSVEEIYEESKRIGEKDSVASVTTFLAVQPHPPLAADHSKSPGRGRKPRRTKQRVCILIEARGKQITEVARSLQDRKSFRMAPMVEKADIVLGTVDIIAVATVPLEKLSGFLANVATLPGVLRTLTLIEMQLPPHADGAGKR